jgi:hypothetical protein
LDYEMASGNSPRQAIALRATVHSREEMGWLALFRQLREGDKKLILSVARYLASKYGEAKPNPVDTQSRAIYP